MFHKEKATRGQIARITGMLASGLIDKPAAQQIIEAFGAPKEVPARDELVAQKLAFWEKEYPGRGAAIMEFLGPFYGVTLKLRPAKPDLKRRVAAMRFGVTSSMVKAVELLPLSQSSSLDYAALSIVEDCNPGCQLQCEKGDAYRERFEDHFKRQSPVQDSSFEESIEAAEYGSSLLSKLEATLYFSLETACECVLNGDVESARRDCQPFLELWLEGYFPFARDVGGTRVLYVLVAG